MNIGKYVLNMGILSTLITGLSVRKQTRQMPQDARRYLVWISWLISLVLAILSVRYAETDQAHITKQKALAKQKNK